MEITNSSKPLDSARLRNIGPRGRRQRAIFGAVALAGALAVVAATLSGMSRPWRLATFPLFWMAAIGLLQARASTCIALARRGSCDVDAGVGTLNADEQQALRQRSRTIAGQATIIALVLTLVVLLLPASI
ncbi:MAG TPA: hypothetical protein VJP86_05545 [Vicinamibacterales bacterium]|nr:hypothetical protein [Vicinamibacterales bacterium]